MNIEEALQMVHGDKTLLAELLVMFCEDFQSFKAETIHALEAADTSALIALLHRLRGSAQALKWNDLGRQAAAAESAVREGQKYGERVVGVTQALERALTDMRRLADELMKARVGQ